MLQDAAPGRRVPCRGLAGLRPPQPSTNVTGGGGHGHGGVCQGDTRVCCVGASGGAALQHVCVCAWRCAHAWGGGLGRGYMRVRGGGAHKKCVHTCTCVCVYVLVHGMHAHVCAHGVRVHTYMCVRTRGVCICARVCMCLHTCVCACARGVCAYIHMCAHIHMCAQGGCAYVHVCVHVLVHGVPTCLCVHVCVHGGRAYIRGA